MATRMKLAALALSALWALVAVGCHNNRKTVLLNDNQQLFQRAQQLIAHRRSLEATKLLGEAGLVTPVPDELQPEIKLALADAYFYDSGIVNTVEAQGRYEQFLSFYPTHPKAAYARYQIGACLFEQSENPENDQEYSQRALDHFRNMVRDIPPGDPWILPAKVMMAKAQDKLADHEWKIAGYYYDKRAYLGAIGRLSEMVETYPAARRRPEAFLRLAQAYQAVGDSEEARLALGRLKRDYPSSALLKSKAALELENQLGKTEATPKNAAAG